jgi:secondary thiamine-phosphate synthase enzyme
VESRELAIDTGGRRGVHDLTDACARFVATASGGGDGILVVFAPHATAGVVVMELGSGSDADVMDALDRLLPRDDRWRHRHGSPGHGADHVLPLLASPSLSVPVIGGRLALGTWQSIALLDPSRTAATAGCASRSCRPDPRPGGGPQPGEARPATWAVTVAGSKVGASQA